MFDEDISLLTKVAESNDSSHHCRLHHDAEFATKNEVLQLVQIGIKPILELNPNSQEKRGYYRPLCRELRKSNPHIPISIGCPHSNEVRRAMYRVLERIIYHAGVNQSACIYLLGRITAIDAALAEQDAAMSTARSSYDAVQKIELGDMHTTVVDELLNINREIVQMCKGVLFVSLDE